MKRQSSTAGKTNLSRKRGRFVTRVMEETEFLAIDLEIVSSRRIDLLVPAFGEHVGVNRNEKIGKKTVLLLSTGRYVRYDDDIDKMINKLILSQVKLVQTLPKEARQQWDNATTRTFDIGIQAGKRPSAYEIRLASRTVSAVSAVGARVQITIYGSLQRHFSN
ncbi:MAG TPA: hypothetical protein VJM08_03030 [Anaerolineales bacterium]|nr:hypothetical protein [Anaerolineales bacterium]